MTDLDALYSWEHWSDFLYRLGAISTPADLQGFASGLLAGGDPLEPEQWRTMAEEFMDLPEPLTDLESKEAMGAYAVLAKQSLSDLDYSFRLFLPDDAVSLTQRAEAIGQWCQSFLNGFGMSETSDDSLDEDGKDMLTSLAAVAQIDSELEESDDNEKLYAELCEFVRVAALYLYQFNQQLLNPEEAPNDASSSESPSQLH